MGVISKMLLFVSPLGDLDIRHLAENYNIDEILKKTVFSESMKSFLDETHVPQNEFAGLSVAEEFFDKVEEEKLGEVEQVPVVWPAHELIADLVSQEGNYKLREKLDQTM